MQTTSVLIWVGWHHQTERPMYKSKFIRLQLTPDRLAELVWNTLNDEKDSVGSTFIRNQAIVANIVSGDPITEKWQSKWRRALTMDEIKQIAVGDLIKCDAEDLVVSEGHKDTFSQFHQRETI
jgi:hypothetical protein